MDSVLEPKELEQETCSIFNENVKEYCWPDHVSSQSEIILDDVSRMNATKVDSIHQVRSIKDIQVLLEYARVNGKKVSSRGTKHSMGGHTLNTDGVVIDMQYINHTQYDPVRNVVVAGTGATWADLIRHLNIYGKAPRTLQSYCSFSIGGTISVNGHGITSDFSVSESVISFTLIKPDGSVIECRRDGETEESRELFGLALGGYGLFGIIYEVTLKVKDNVRLLMDTIMTDLHDLPHIFEPMVEASLNQEIEIKLARIDITTFNVADVYVFKRCSPTPTVSNLPDKPKEMSQFSKVIYKWAAGPLREIRFAIEHTYGVALDWSNVSDSNLLLYESAAPLAKLYSPFLMIDDTFILQEYFVPHANFNTWIAQTKNVVVEQILKETLITLLNITIRYVHHDTDTALPYSKSQGGSYAFVFYYRIARTAQAEQILANYHNILANITLGDNGTFYLPYRHHYSQQQLLEAYPSFPKFVEKKQHYDPELMFSNQWFQQYSGLNLTPDRKVDQNNNNNEELALSSNSSSSSSSTTSSPSSINLELNQFIYLKRKEGQDTAKIGELIKNVTIRRTNSFRMLLKDPQLRQQFTDTFLVDILSLAENNNILMGMINSAAWDRRLKEDNDIYLTLWDKIKGRGGGGPIAQFMGIWKQVKQLYNQRQELVRETVSVLTRLGLVGKIHNICSIGDHGKLLNSLKTELKTEGQAWVVHDRQSNDDDIGSVLERGVVDQVGTFVKIDYLHMHRDGREFPGIPDGSCDLVTMNQGLHHLPPDQLLCFITAVNRILRVGGIFIIREHDLNEKLMPMLDCAHMAFNLLTGVTPNEEKIEIRGFRSVQDWRTIVESCGFIDTMIYELQNNDPTVDIMICFAKVVNDPRCTPSSPSQHAPIVTSSSVRKLPAGSVVSKPLANNSSLHLVLNQLPQYTLSTMKVLLELFLKGLPKFQSFMVGTIRDLVAKQNIPGLANLVEIMINSYVNPAITILQRFRPLTDAAIPQTDTSFQIIPEEFYLLIHALRARAKKGGILETAVVSIMDKLLGLKEEVMESTTNLVNSGNNINNNNNNNNQNNNGSGGDGTNSPFYQEMLQHMKVFFNTFKEFNDLSEIVLSLGLPKRASNLLVNFVPKDTNVEKISGVLANQMDRTRCTAFVGAISDICRTKTKPTMDLMTSDGTSWNRAMIALLGSPNIQFSATQVSLSSLVGLSGFMALWRKAQDNAKKTNDAIRQNEKPLDKDVLDALDAICPIVKFEGKGGAVIEDVYCVVSATYSHSSITRMVSDVNVDITQLANNAIDLETGVLDLSNIKGSKTGFLNVAGATGWRAGRERYIIEYRRMPDMRHMDKFKQSTQVLAAALGRSGAINPAHNASNAITNYYKLPEWLQVELVELFAQFMGHTPWYRFPFNKIMTKYFGILFKEVSLVSSEFGIFRALSDTGFITDLVPGIVMSIIMGQMSLLAFPCRMYLGDGYDDSNMFEEVVLLGPTNTNWSELDSRIVSSKVLGHGLTILKLPNFVPFTEIIIKIAQQVPLASIIQISNNTSIQIKLLVPHDRLKQSTAAIEQFDDVKVNFDFNLLEGEMGNNRHFLSVSVPIIKLLSFVRHCLGLKEKGIEIAQIYDYY